MQKLVCPIHPDQIIKKVCLNLDCQKRALCAICLSRHNFLHVKDTVSIEKFLNQKSQVNGDDIISQKEKLLSTKVDQVFDKLLSTCVEICMKKKEMIRQEIQKKLLLEKEQINNLKAKYYSEVQKLTSNIAEDPFWNSLNDFIDSLTKSKLSLDHIDRDNKSLIEIINKSSSSIQDSIDKCASQIESVLKIQSAQWKKEIRPVEIDHKKVRLHKEFKLKAFGAHGHSIEFIKKKSLLAIGDRGGNLSIWDSDDYQMYHMRKVHDLFISNIKYSERNDYLFTASPDQYIKVFRVSQKKTPPA